MWSILCVCVHMYVCGVYVCVIATNFSKLFQMLDIISSDLDQLTIEEIVKGS